MSSVRAYLVALVAICMVLATCGFVLVLSQAHGVSRRQAAAHAEETARALSQAVDAELERADGVLAALSASDAVRHHDWAAVDREARAAFANPSTWIVVQDRNGQQHVNTGLPAGAALPRTAAPVEMWRELDRGNRHVCNLVHGAVAPNIVCLDVGVDRNPQPQYAITVVFLPRAFEKIVTRLNNADGELASLVDRDGFVIWRNIRPASFVGRQASDALLTVLKSSGRQGIIESRSLENVPMLTAYQRSALSGWSVIVGLPIDRLDASQRAALLRGSLLSLGILLLGCVLALILGRRLTNGLKLMVDVLGSTSGEGPVHATGLAEFDAAATALRQASAARTRSERHQQMLIGELNHRVKNTLAIVQSLAHQTFRGGTTSETAIKAFESRLQALGAAHNLLTREGWLGAPMPEIVADALAPFCTPNRCRVSGPSLSVPPQMAVSLALALHELATNAVKYGALSAPTGVVGVKWRIAGNAFKLTWEEKGGPPVTEPEREGFGTRLIKRSLASQLNGEVKMDFAKTGLRCVVTGTLPSTEDPNILDTLAKHSAGA